MLSFLPRSLIKAFQFKRVLSNLALYYPTVNRNNSSAFMDMERIDRILSQDEDLEERIMDLRCEVTDVEAKLLDHFLIERLIKENEELENEIKKYKEELINLEILNNRVQAYSICRRVLDQVAATKVNRDHLKASKADTSKTEQIEKPENKADSVSKKPKKDVKKGSKAENKKSDKADTKKTDGEDMPVDVGRLNMKVGKILQIEKHPDADSLYVEKVDIGKEEPITVVSGLVKHISASDMLNTLVIILCNLKPAKMRGVTSEGMVMCASTENKVEVLRPPAGSVPGDMITCPGYNSNPDAVLNPKKKIFETVAPDLKTDDEMFATYKGVRWSVGDKGFVQAQTLKGANIK